MEYRIVTNGYMYKVQYKDEYCNWIPMMLFRTETAAKDLVESMKRGDQEMSPATWVLVDKINEEK